MSQGEPAGPSSHEATLSLMHGQSTWPDHTAAGPLPSPDFGEYKLVREIARGGMGVVYEARHVRLERTVALKMILSGALASELELKRFFVEAQAAAQLDHPGIVPIYEIGEAQGRHFFTMALIEGPSLHERLREGPLPPREAASLLRQVVQAVTAAHDKGILHRDLKPQNILIDRAGQPKVTDFGLAKHLDHRDGLTATGEVLGTPSYMAPEQATGRISALGPQVDVYALGAILYAMLSGRPPFQAASLMETLRQVVETDPAPLRLLNRNIDRDLETICMKCLEKDPARRYATAQALVDDLDRYLQGDSISARSFNALERVARTLERSQIDEGYESWSAILLWWSGLVLVGQLLIFGLIVSGGSALLVNVALAVQFLVLVIPVWFYRAWHSLTANAAQKQLWTVWLGFVLACLATGQAAQGMLGLEKMYEFYYMPHLMIVSGLCFFTLGNQYWGWLYGIGVLFFAAAWASSYYLPSSPLVFALLWSFSLALIGLRLRRRRSAML